MKIDQFSPVGAAGGKSISSCKHILLYFIENEMPLAHNKAYTGKKLKRDKRVYEKSERVYPSVKLPYRNSFCLTRLKRIRFVFKTH